jgi:hypothetical protein
MVSFISCRYEICKEIIKPLRDIDYRTRTLHTWDKNPHITVRKVGDEIEGKS